MPANSTSLHFPILVSDEAWQASEDAYNGLSITDDERAEIARCVQLVIDTMGQDIYVGLGQSLWAAYSAKYTY